MSDYLAYQEKYRDTPRDSDRELINLINARVPQGGRVLDVGCSTGNLLRHLYTARPDLLLMGTDADPNALEAFRLIEAFAVDGILEQPDPELIFLPNRSCFHGDVTDSQSWDWLGVGFFDAIIANALFYCFTDEQMVTALRKLWRILKPGGELFIWDLMHPWQQRLTITERSPRYETSTLHIRPYSDVKNLAVHAGFENGVDMEIYPCKPPQLLKPNDCLDMTSWTQHGISFRGGLAQPWCHAILLK